VWLSKHFPITNRGGLAMKQYDLVIQLGSQVRWVPDGGCYQLAPHTDMRTEAAALVVKNGITPRLIISGGSNFGVRYDDDKVFNEQHPTQKKPIFSFEAFANSDYNRKSEAAVIKDFLVREYMIDSSRILAEGLSSTTEENVEFVKIMLRRRPMFTGQEKIGVLTLGFHMTKALPLFLDAGLDVAPVLAEDVLANQQATWSERLKQIDRIKTYYSSPKGGVQYNIQHLEQLLRDGKSVVELFAPWWRLSVTNGFVCADEPVEKGHTYFVQAFHRKEAAVKFRQDHVLAPYEFENCIKGPFATEELARKV